MKRVKRGGRGEKEWGKVGGWGMIREKKNGRRERRERKKEKEKRGERRRENLT